MLRPVRHGRSLLPAECSNKREIPLPRKQPNRLLAWSRLLLQIAG